MHVLECNTLHTTENALHTKQNALLDISQNGLRRPIRPGTCLLPGALRAVVSYNSAVMNKSSFVDEEKLFLAADFGKARNNIFGHRQTFLRYRADGSVI